MRSPIRLRSVTASPVAVEGEFGALCKDASQSSIADACGLSCHTTISERFGKAVRKGFLASFTAEQFLRMGAASGPVQAATLAYWQTQNVGDSTPATLKEEVRREISDDAALIAKCNDALADDKLSPSERADLVLALRKSIDNRMQLVAHLRVSMGAGQ